MLSKSSASLVNEVTDCRQETKRWYQSVSGQNAASGIQSAVEEMSSDVFGYYALQLGELAGQYTLLQDSRISSCFAVAPLPADDNNIALVADAAALPLEFDNIDLVVGSHVLDCAASPHQVLREIERVLVPEGHCILIAYNPFSWRGIGLLWKRLRKQEGAPAIYTSFRLRDWFAVLGFEVVEIRTTGFRPRRNENKLLRRLRFLDEMVGHYRRLFGNVRLIHVRKKVSKRIPMKPKLRTKPLLEPGIAVNGSSAGKTIKQMERQENGE